MYSNLPHRLNMIGKHSIVPSLLIRTIVKIRLKECNAKLFFSFLCFFKNLFFVCSCNGLSFSGVSVSMAHFLDLFLFCTKDLPLNFFEAICRVLHGKQHCFATPLINLFQIITIAAAALKLSCNDELLILMVFLL